MMLSSLCWTVRKRRNPKSLCSWACFEEIDSFAMFKNKELVRLVKESKDRVCLIIFKNSLVATLQDDDSLRVCFSGGSYTISVEKRPCHYGGHYYFFHCPACNARMRKLYCIDGVYLCRKCAHLGYFSQRLGPVERHLMASKKIEECLKYRAGSLEQKPVWMKWYTFQRIKAKHHSLEQYFSPLNEDLWAT